MNQALLQRAILRVMPAARATGLFVSLATFQSSDAADFPDGFYSGVYQDLPGLVNIPCTSPPVSEARIQAVEVKNLQDITSSELHHVLLNGFFPQLVTGWRQGWIVVIDGVIFDVFGVESDSQNQMTRVTARRVSI